MPRCARAPAGAGRMNPSTQGPTWPPDITGTFTHSPMSPEPPHRHCCVEACHMCYLSQCPGPIQPHICGPHCEDMEPHGHSVTGAHQTRAPTGIAQPRGQTGPTRPHSIRLRYKRPWSTWSELQAVTQTVSQTVSRTEGCVVPRQARRHSQSYRLILTDMSLRVAGSA